MLFSLSCVLTLIVHVSSRSISNHQERLSSRIHCMRTERLSAARYLRVSSCTFREDTRTPLREEALSFYQGLDRCDVVFHEPNTLVRRWRRFSGSIDTRPASDSLIIMANIGFTPTMRVNAASRNMLSRLSQRHHVMQRTWTT